MKIWFACNTVLLEARAEDSGGCTGVGGVSIILSPAPQVILVLRDIIFF